MTSLHVVRSVADDRDATTDVATDPRDPALFRSGLASARAALRDGVARRHDRSRTEAVDDTEEPR